MEGNEDSEKNVNEQGREAGWGLSIRGGDPSMRQMCRGMNSVGPNLELSCNKPLCRFLFERDDGNLRFFKEAFLLAQGDCKYNDGTAGAC